MIRRSIVREPLPGELGRSGPVPRWMQAYPDLAMCPKGPSLRWSKVLENEATLGLGNNPLQIVSGTPAKEKTIDTVSQYLHFINSLGMGSAHGNRTN